MTVEAGVPRFETRRLVAGRGNFTGDISLSRLNHVAFLRSPHAHARIVSINAATARALPGITCVATWSDLSPVCKAMQTVNATDPNHVSPAQTALAKDVVRWQGEPVVAVVADTLARADDALEAIDIEYEVLPAITDAHAALVPHSAVLHESLATNCALNRVFGKADIIPEIQKGEVVIERNFHFNRHTGVPLEARVILVDYNPIDGTLLARHSHQVPHLIQDVFADLLNIPLDHVRVVCGDVGGGFGIKLHVYPDELATAALAKLLGRPVRFECRRSEAFISDAHAREFEVTAKIAANADGTIAAIDADILCATGAYPIYPRGSAGDAVLASLVLGAPYRVAVQRARARATYLNKVPVGSYRGVGQPIGCTVTEVLVDEAAHALGIDPVEFRLRSYHALEALPLRTAGGFFLQSASLSACLGELVSSMDYGKLRVEQSRLREAGRLIGIGVATFLEITAPGALLFGPTGIKVTSQENAIIKIDATAKVRCAVGCTDQGQGTLTGIAQIIAETLGIPLDHVAVEAGDTAGPHGGGAWASRGLTLGGEAAHRATCALRKQVLELAATLLQASPANLDIRSAQIVNAEDGRPLMPLAELCHLGHYRQDTLPRGVTPQFTATGSFVSDAPYFAANGAQGCLLEIDPETGAIALLHHWIAEDCGRVINADLVNGQLRGGITQGVGAAVMEHCVYDDAGQLLAGSLMDYAVPRADTTPPIEIVHLVTPQPGTALGTKGAGEAGTVGASAAVWCAVNDALRHLGVHMESMPFTAERVLAAIHGRRRLLEEG